MKLREECEKAKGEGVGRERPVPEERPGIIKYKQAPKLSLGLVCFFRGIVVDIPLGLEDGAVGANPYSYSVLPTRNSIHRAPGRRPGPAGPFLRSADGGRH